MIVKTYFQKVEEEGLKRGMEKGLQKGMEKGLQDGIQKGLQKGLEGELHAKIEKLASEVEFHQCELAKWKTLIKNKDVTKEVYDTMVKPIKNRVAKNKKEIALVRNKIKKLKSKKK